MPWAEDQVTYPHKTTNKTLKWKKSSYRNITLKRPKANLSNSSACITKTKTKLEKDIRRMRSCRRFRALWKKARRKGKELLYDCVNGRTDTYVMEKKYGFRRMKASERPLYRNATIIHLPDMEGRGKLSNWSAYNTTGEKWEKQLSDMWRTATRANGAKRSDMHHTDYCSRTTFQTSLGGLSRWTSLQICQNQMDMIRYSSSLIVWPNEPFYIMQKGLRHTAIHITLYATYCKTAWNSKGYHHRQRKPVHLGTMETNHRKIRNWTKTKYSIPPANRRPNWKNQCDTGTISAGICQLSAGQLEQTLCNLLLSIARFPEGDPAILWGQGGEASMEISTRDIIKMRD